MPDTKLDTNNISLAGEFAVLAQLALNGFVANMTLGRAKGIDILVFNPDTDRMLKLEVKTTQKPLKLGWLMSEKHARPDPDPKLFYCFVSITETNSFRFFVVPSAVVADYLSRSHEHWADEKPSRNRGTPMRIFHLVATLAGIPPPAMEQYEDNWKTLRGA